MIETKSIAHRNQPNCCASLPTLPASNTHAIPVQECNHRSEERSLQNVMRERHVPYNSIWHHQPPWSVTMELEKVPCPISTLAQEEILSSCAQRVTEKVSPSLWLGHRQHRWPKLLTAPDHSTLLSCWMSTPVPCPPWPMRIMFLMHLSFLDSITQDQQT